LPPGFPRWTILAAVLLADVAWAAVFPVLSEFVDRLGLGALGGGVLVALPALAVSIVTVPAAGVVNRFGARRVLAGSLAVSAAGTALFPLIPGVPAAVVNRIGFGIGLGIIWVAGSEWLSQLERRQPTRTGVSAVVVASGLGIAIAPPISGVLASVGGLSTPFLAFGAVQVVCMAAVLLARQDTAAEQPPEALVAGGWRATARDPRVVFASAGLFLSGFVGNGSNVLASLDLHSQGLSEAAIGWILAISVVTYLVTTLVVSNSKLRIVGTVLLVAAVIAETLSFTPAAINPTVALIATTLFVVGLTRGYVSTIALPYAETAGRSARISTTIVFGFVFGVWSSSAVVAPLAAGGLSQALPNDAWLALELVALAGLAIVGLYARRLAGAASNEQRRASDSPLSLDR
jgi:predicted MFS family arabinose efflux permease